MHWEALIVIGGFALILGAVLLVPGLWWARRKARSNPVVGSIKVTRAGYIGFAVFVAVLLAGFSAEHWAQGSKLGLLIGLPGAKLVFLLLATGAGWLIERSLAAKGIRFTAVVPRNDV